MGRFGSRAFLGGRCGQVLRHPEQLAAAVLLPLLPGKIIDFDCDEDHLQVRAQNSISFVADLFAA